MATLPNVSGCEQGSPMAISSFSAGVLSEQGPTESADRWQEPALIYDYRQAANPIRKGLTEPIPPESLRPVGCAANRL